MKALGVFVFCTLLSLPFSLYNSWLFTDMWKWFVVPFGVMELSVAHAWGVGLIVCWYLVGLVKSEKTDDILDVVPVLINSMVTNSLAVTLFYFTGRILKEWM